MLDFVKRAFRGLMEVVLWLNLVACSIGIAVLWHSVWLPGRGFVGFIIGVIVGLLVNIVLGGFVATFLEMAEDVGQMKRKLDRLGNLNSSASASNASAPFIQSPLASNTGDTWYCKKCSTVNALTATACKDCGAYK